MTSRGCRAVNKLLSSLSHALVLQVPTRFGQSRNMRPTKMNRTVSDDGSVDLRFKKKRGRRSRRDPEDAPGTEISNTIPEYRAKKGNSRHLMGPCPLADRNPV